MKHFNRTFSNMTSMKTAKYIYAVRLVSQFLVHVNGLTTPNLWASALVIDIVDEATYSCEILDCLSWLHTLKASRLNMCM